MTKRVLFSGPLWKHKAALDAERERMREAGRDLREREVAEHERESAEAAARLRGETPSRTVVAQTIVEAPRANGSHRGRRTRCMAAPLVERSTGSGNTSCDARSIDARPLWRYAIGAVVAVVANAYEVPPVLLWKHGRGAASAARCVVWYLLRERYAMPLTEIGRAFGRHHTTVLSGVRKVERAMERTGRTSKTIEQVLYELNGEA